MLRCFVAMTAVVLPIAALAQSAMSERQRLANDAFIARDWSKAVEAYQALIRENPSAAQPHFRLAVAMTGLRKHNEARPHPVTAESRVRPRRRLRSAWRRFMPPPAQSTARSNSSSARRRRDWQSHQFHSTATRTWRCSRGAAAVYGPRAHAPNVFPAARRECASVLRAHHGQRCDVAGELRSHLHEGRAAS